MRMQAALADGRRRSPAPNRTVTTSDCTGAINSAIAVGGPALAAGSQVSRLAASDAVAGGTDHGRSGACGPGASAPPENPLGDEFRFGRSDPASLASPVDIEERAS